MSRVQLALRVSDLEGSIAFYRSLLGAEPAKRRPGYANFAIAEPPLKLVLIEGEPDRPTVLDHLGVEVETTADVTEATARLSALAAPEPWPVGGFMPARRRARPARTPGAAGPGERGSRPRYRAAPPR